MVFLISFWQAAGLRTVDTQAAEPRIAAAEEAAGPRTAAAAGAAGPRTAAAAGAAGPRTAAAEEAAERIAAPEEEAEPRIAAPEAEPRAAAPAHPFAPHISGRTSRYLLSGIRILYKNSPCHNLPLNIAFAYTTIKV